MEGEKGGPGREGPGGAGALVPPQALAAVAAKLPEKAGQVRAASRAGLAPLGLGLGVFACVILFVNPLREAALEDDWAYARTVRRLHETGQFHLDPWLSANMPFQAYWGEAFARLFGYSFASLRVSTLVLVLCGLTAFFFLAREHGLSPPQAGLLMLWLIASPIVLYFSFNFMTDVPYLMGLTIASFFYTRALRRHSYPLMVVASLAAAAAILTRQFGVALVAALLAQWVLAKDRWRRLPLFLSGLVLPAAVGLWQFYEGLTSPTWAAAFNQHGQLLFLKSGLVFVDAPWRLALIVEYTALFALPLVFLALLTLVYDWPRAVRKVLLGAALLAAVLCGGEAARHGRQRVAGGSDLVLGETLLALSGVALVLGAVWLLRRPDELEREPAATPHGASRRFRLLALALPAAVLLAGLGLWRWYGAQHLARFMGSSAVHVPEPDERWTVPFLPWIFQYPFESMRLRDRTLLFAAMLAGGVLLARLFVVRWRAYRAGGIPPAQRFLDLVTLFLLAAALVYHHLGDEYLMVFLPFALILVGRRLGPWWERPGFRAVTTAACLLTLAVSALWVRGRLDEAAARWQAAEAVRATGVAPQRIWGNWEWSCYHGAFDDYLADLAGRTPETFDDFFDWWGKQGSKARFVVAQDTRELPLQSLVDGGVIAKGAKLEIAVPYRNWLFQPREVVVLKARGDKPGLDTD